MRIPLGEICINIEEGGDESEDNLIIRVVRIATLLLSLKETLFDKYRYSEMRTKFAVWDTVIVLAHVSLEFLN